MGPDAGSDKARRRPAGRRCRNGDRGGAGVLYCADMYRLYGALLRLAWAAVLPYQIVIPWLNGGSRPRLGERLGRPGNGAEPRSGGLWVHAVSVGEVRLALPLLARLRERFPGWPLHLTTSTPTGRALAEGARTGAGPGRSDTVSELPFDLAGSMGRFLDLLQPRALLIMETEIWPNLLRLCGRRGIPVVLVNGRISLRSYGRYRVVRPFLRRALLDIRLFGMQSEDDARRIISLGAPEGRVRVTGNLKFDLPLPSTPGEATRERLGLAPGEPLFVAGSTAPGEEAPVLEAFRALRQADPRARLVLAPRHPERFARAGEILRASGLRVANWSALPAPGAYEALLLDAVGVLPLLYAAADLVFVGGSLVPRGGHNILEPAALGKPVLFGPHMDNFKEPARALTAAGAAFVARDGRELGSLAVRLLSDPAAYRVASALARRVVEANRGALARTIEALDEVLSPGSEAPGLAAART
jgi:3-deoxy-D-manno-octulosonic-acid transferase